jgi:nitroreductase
MSMPTSRQGADDYQAILRRRSVRRYDKTPLDEAALTAVQDTVSKATPLIPANRLDVTIRDDVVRRDLAMLFGAYGRLITPQHALVPTMRGESHVLTDLGYRVEQIVVRMTVLGIGTCYIGTLPTEERARAILDVPPDARIGALVVFGRPAEAAGGRAYNRLIRSVLGRNREPDLGRFFFQDSLTSPAQPPESLRPVILAAARAPSACNAQPWRFLWRDGRLWLFVTRNNPKYGHGASEQYCLYDAGIGMANITLAMHTWSLAGEWQPVDPGDATVPPHPVDLHPIAMLRITEASGSAREPSREATATDG